MPPSGLSSCRKAAKAQFAGARVRTVRGTNSSGGGKMNLMNSVVAFALAAALPANEPIRVTRADVDWSNEKVGMAYNALADMWTKEFQRIGDRFAVPRVVRYRGNAMTACGMISANNAQYCSASNAIYYDEVFVAGMAKISARNLGTDGDMTGIGII